MYLIRKVFVIYQAIYYLRAVQMRTKQLIRVQNFQIVNDKTVVLFMFLIRGKDVTHIHASIVLQLQIKIKKRTCEISVHIYKFLFAGKKISRLDMFKLALTKTNFKCK